MSKPTVSVFGLGIIGSIWAKHYSEAGMLAGCWNRTPKPEFYGWLDDPLEAAEKADLLHLCLYDPASVEGILQRILPALNEGKMLIQSTTIDPASAERFAEMVRSTGARYVESPFTGSKPAAEQKQLVYFMGGQKEDLDAAEEVLSLLSRKRFRFDSPTQATTIKLAMNHQIGAISEALCEGVTWAMRSGLSSDQFFDVMRENVSWSRLSEMKEGKIKGNEFSPQFSIKNLHKDMRLAVESCPVDLPSLALVHERLRVTEDAGFGEDDFISLIRTLG